MRREDQRPDRDSDKLWEEFDAERTTVDTGELAQLSTNRDELIRLVGDALTEKFGERPAVDDDRDFVLHHMGQPVWIRVHADFPAITIMARVGHGVYSRRATEVELDPQPHRHVQPLVAGRSRRLAGDRHGCTAVRPAPLVSPHR